MGETILVVDDEQQIRQTVRGVLADEGYDVVEAENGRRALDVLAERSPQLALVDIWMPEVDGIELVQRMRHDAPGLPIIVMSGHGTIETAVQVIRMGAADFLEKPFKLDALLAAVTRVLREHEPAAPVRDVPAVAAAPSNGIARVVAQQTIGRSVVVNGQGLHSGVRTGLILEPLPPSSGIVFEDITSRERVPGLVDYIDSTGYATTLVSGGMAAKTVEHLMAALHAHGVTNLLVKMYGEVPILDGSAQDLCALVADAGVVEQDAVIEPIVIDRVYGAEVGDPAKKSIRIEPSDVFEVRYELEYPAPIGRQDYDFKLTGPEAFAREIAPARTFGFVKEIEFLEQMGLASGGRLNNFILVGDEGVVNAPLRFDDEFVRHKILDIVGDFYLLGRPIRGRVVARRTGHGDNAALLRVLRERFGLPPLRPVESSRAG